MTPANYNFLGFSLDPRDRQLRREGEPVELNARYFDALALLVSEAGSLVSKDRFLQDIWRGVPVTDEALTQCIKTLRRQLGDQVAVPRFIETVPKHGYRFIAPVTATPADAAPDADLTHADAAGRNWRQVGLLAAAGTLGGALAGLFGGVMYGFATAAPPSASGAGEASAVLVLICLTVLAGLIGGAGVSGGIALTGRARGGHWWWLTLGGAAGGLVIGAIARLIGLDGFNFLLGRSPTDITGGAEGLLLGSAVGLGSWLACRAGARSLDRAIAPAALLGAAAGALIPLFGGRMMGGSLDSLAGQFPGSRLRLDQIGQVFGESGFGPLSQSVTGAIEGALFAAGIAGAMLLAQRTSILRR
jgi:DNA-binding winged helix-turn-helix (wHTH) protein